MSAQYSSAGLASAYRTIRRSSTHAPAVEPGLASRHSGRHARQACGVTCQAWANASRSTVAAASSRPRWIEGVLANA